MFIGIDAVLADLQWLAPCGGLRELQLMGAARSDGGEWEDISDSSSEDEDEDDDGGEGEDDSGRPRLSLGPLQSLRRLDVLVVDSPHLRSVRPFRHCSPGRVSLAGCRRLRSIAALVVSATTGRQPLGIAHLYLSRTGLCSLPPDMATGLPWLESLGLTNAGGLSSSAGDSSGDPLAVASLAALAACPALRVLSATIIDGGGPSSAQERTGKTAAAWAGGAVAARQRLRRAAVGAAAGAVPRGRTPSTTTMTTPPAGMGFASCAELRVLVVEDARRLALDGLASLPGLVALRVTEAPLRREVPFPASAAAGRRALKVRWDNSQGVGHRTKMEGGEGEEWPPAVDLAPVAAALRLETLTLTLVGPARPTDLSPLTDLRRLRRVDLRGMPVASLDALAASGPALEWVRVDTDGRGMSHHRGHHSQLTTLGDIFAASRRLMRLELRCATVADVASLRGCTGLRVLVLRGCHALEGVDGILPSLARLEELGLPFSGVRRLEALHHCPRLRRLCLDGLDSLEALGGLPQSLDTLAVAARNLRAIGDPNRPGGVQWAGGVVGAAGERPHTAAGAALHAAERGQVTRADDAGGAARAHFPCTALANVATLGSASRPSMLALRGTAVANLSQLKSRLQGSLTILELDGCRPLTDVAALRFGAHLVRLSLTGTPVHDVAPLASCSQLRELVLDGCDALFSLDGLAQAPRLVALCAQRMAARSARGVWRRRSLTNVSFQGSADLDADHVRKFAEREDIQFLAPDSPFQLTTSQESVVVKLFFGASE